MAVEEKLRSNYYKLLLFILKYIPIIIGICYIINTMYYIEPLSNIAGMSLFTWIFIYIASIVFKFCVYHRLFLWYILIDDLFNIIDYYWQMPISTNAIIRMHNVLLGIFIITMIVIYVKKNKRNTIKNSK